MNLYYKTVKRILFGIEIISLGRVKFSLSHLTSTQFMQIFIVIIVGVCSAFQFHCYHVDSRADGYFFDQGW